MARCLLIESKLAKVLWTYAVMAAVYIRNRCYNPRTWKTPFEVMTCRKPNLGNMHIFGTPCYAYVQNKKKLDPRSEKGIFVGYDKGSPAYSVYFTERNIMVRKVRCVKFTDKVDDVNNVPQPYDDVYVKPTTEVAGREAVQNDDEVKIDETEMRARDDRDDTSVRFVVRYPARQRSKPKYLEDYVESMEVEDCDVTLDYCYKVLYDIPITYQEAVSSSESAKWQKAMDDQMNALRDNDTFELTHVPEDRKIVGGRWVYTVKPGPNNEEQYKARFVAKGYSQTPDIDYDETFSPTARITSMKVLLQLAVKYDLLVDQMDVKTAYLNAPIDCELYTEQPEGFVTRDRNGEK